MFPEESCLKLMGIRKAQAFTIRYSGLDQPISPMGSLRLCTSLVGDIIARSHFEGPVRVAIEQIKMYVLIKARDKGMKKYGC